MFKVARTLALVASLLLVAPGADAQSYPSKAVTLVIAYSAGSIIDIPLRLALPRVGDSLGQPVLMVHRPGAGGAIATDAVIAAGSDGHTLLVNGDQLVTAPQLMPRTVKYDVFRDLAPITRLITLPFAFLVNNNVPAGTLAEFIALARSGKAKLSYGTPGNGTANHLTTEYFKALTGAEILHVPYKGAPAAINDLLAGRIDLILLAIQTASVQSKTGKVRALAVAGAARAPQLPGTPTFAEVGLAEFDPGTTFGLLAAAGTPQPVIQRLHSEFAGALRSPEIRKQIEDAGTIVTADTPAEFGRKLRADYERNAKMIRENRIQPE